MQIKAGSDRAKTVREAITVGAESRWDINSFLTYCNYKNQSISPDTLILDKYKDVLIDLCVSIELKPMYYFRPQLFALDYYGTANMDFLVMYFSGIYSTYEFKAPRIKVFPPEHLRFLNEILGINKVVLDENKKKPVEYSDLTLYPL